MRPAQAGLLVLSVLAVVSGALLGLRSHAQARARAWRAVDVASCPRAAVLGGDCGRCVAAGCCPQVTACYASADCIDLNDCWVTCGEHEGDEGDRATCSARCEKKHPASVAVFHAWDDCVRAACEDVCPRESEE